MKTVFGFVRRHEKAESTNAPTMIKYMILNYYLLTDSFGEHGASINRYKLRNGHTLAKLNYIADGCSYVANPLQRSVHGTLEIGDVDEGIEEYQWALRVRSNDKCQPYFSVGVCPPSPSVLRKLLHTNHSSCIGGMYGLSFNFGRAYSIINGEGGRGTDREWGRVTLRSYDRVDVKLNVKKAKVTFLVNGLRWGIDIRTSKSRRFRLVVCLNMTHNTSVELTNFWITQTSRIRK